MGGWAGISVGGGGKVLDRWVRKGEKELWERREEGKCLTPLSPTPTPEGSVRPLPLSVYMFVPVGEEEGGKEE